MLFMLHGWLDCAASFQFLVDALPDAWHIIAPDWRGHGQSHRTHESYPFMQLVADLDALLEHYTPQTPAALVAHSLGANVAALYAGVRPARVAKLVNLEGLGPIPGFKVGEPASIIDDWLTKLRMGPRNRTYTDREQVVARLVQANPRLPPERALFLADEFSRLRDDGHLEFDADAYEHASFPMFDHHRVVESAWPRIAAPVLLITGSESFVMKAFAGEPRCLLRRLALLRDVRHIDLPHVGHNIHHEAPEKIAPFISEFLNPSARRDPT